MRSTNRNSRSRETAEAARPRAATSSRKVGKWWRRALLTIWLLALLLVAYQRDVWGDLQDLVALLSSSEIIVHQLPPAPAPPARAAICEQPNAFDRAAARLLRGAQTEIAELREQLDRNQGELVQARAVEQQLRQLVEDQRHQQGKRRSQPAGSEDAKGGGTFTLANFEKRVERGLQEELSRRGIRLQDARGEAAEGAFADRFRVRHTKVALLGSDAWITGTVENRSATTAQPLVVVHLLRSGRREASRELRLTVDAGQSAPFEARIPTQLAAGTYSAQVEIEP